MPLKVIGAGFGRTGTLSLKFALEQLGFGPCYHMMEVFKREAVADWDRAFDSEKPDWETIFAGYSSTVDWPSTTVRESLPAERLLIYDVAEGWEPLCEFLDVPVPDGPMPRVNSRDEFQARLSAGSAEPAH